MSISTRVCGSSAATARAHLVAVKLGEVPVEHEHVIAARARFEQGAQPVVGEVHRQPFAPEAAADRLSHATLVFGHEHAHARRLGAASKAFVKSGLFFIWT